MVQIKKQHTHNFQLNFPGITVTGVKVQPQGGGAANKLTTFWQQSDVDLSRGMDFQPRGSVFVRFTHLNHQPFSYQITVDNKSNGARRGTCRIFIAPKFDERGNPWQFTEQRNMFIELDRFIVNCKLHSSDLLLQNKRYTQKMTNENKRHLFQ